METSQNKPSRRKGSKAVGADLSTAITALVESGDLKPSEPISAQNDTLPVKQQMCAPAPLNGTVSPCGKFMYVTSHELRRSIMTGEIRHQKLKLYADQLRKITSFAMQMGITWDELLRAVIDSELASNAPFSCAAHFVPEPAV